MSDNQEAIYVNEKKEHHNCEMTFSCYFDHDKSDFMVDSEQKYTIHTTIKEVEALNEGLNIYQEDGFKDTFLLFQSEVDGSIKYPDFAPRVQRAQELGKQLQSLAKDEDSLVALQEYCLEVPPTYVDDFYINKKIESITLEGKRRETNGYEELKAYISELKKEKAALFI